MRIVLFACLSFCLVMTNCKGDNVSEKTEETQDQIDARTISQTDIEALRYTEFELSSDSKKAVADWQKFQELQIQTSALKKGDLIFFEMERLLFTTFFSELITEMPTPLQTNEISARLTALNTKAQKLNSLLRLANIEKAERLQAIKEYLITVSNLNLQINKKFEFEKNNVLRPE